MFNCSTVSTILIKFTLLPFFMLWFYINASTPDFIHRIYDDSKSNLEAAILELCYFGSKAF